MQEWTRENKQPNPKKQCLPGAGVSGSGEDPKKTAGSLCLPGFGALLSGEALSERQHSAEDTRSGFERPQPGGLKKGERYVSEAS